MKEKHTEQELEESRGIVKNRVNELLGEFNPNMCAIVVLDEDTIAFNILGCGNGNDQLKCLGALDKLKDMLCQNLRR